MEHFPMIFVGNKVDLDDGSCESRREVSEEEGRLLAHRFGAPWVEVSAKWNLRVEEAVHALIRCIPRTGMDYQLAIVGGGGVGKSAFCVQFIQKYEKTITTFFL